MKKITFTLAFIAMVLFAFSCSNNNKENDSSAIKIVLNKRIAEVDGKKTTDKIAILKGNGDYTLTVKSVFVVDDLDTEHPEKYNKVYIKDDTIYVERLYKEDVYICAYYVLHDSKGQQKTFAIENPGTLGLHEFPD